MNELTEQQILYFQEWIKDLKEQFMGLINGKNNRKLKI